VGNSPSFDCNLNSSFVFRRPTSTVPGNGLPVAGNEIAGFHEEIVSFVEILME